MKLKKGFPEIDTETDPYYKALAKSQEVFKKKEYDLALEILSEAIKLNEETDECTGERADYHIRRAEIYRAKNDKDSELTALTKAIELRGFDWDFQKRGQVHEEKGDYDAAIADYTKAIENGEDPNSYELRAKAFLKKKDYKSAIADFTKAIETCSNEKCKGCTENHYMREQILRTIHNQNLKNTQA